MRRGLFIAAIGVLMAAAVAARPGGFARPREAQAAAHQLPQLHAAARISKHLPHVTVLSADIKPAVLRVVLGATTSKRLVALTFDLDMTSSMAAEVTSGTSWFNLDALDYLRSQQVHATMFMTGMWAEIYPTVAREIANDPAFEIGNHSYSHPAFHSPCYRLDSVSRSAQAQQIRLAQQAIAQITGVTPKYFRFPGGCYDRQAVDLVHAAGLIPVEWNVNSIDAFNPYAPQIAATVLSQVRPGSVIIMHLQAGVNAPATAQALRMIVPTLQRMGYQFVTISELLSAGPAIQPTDPREVVEAAPSPAPTPTAAPTPARAVLVKPTPRWCGWVTIRNGRSWLCR